MVSLFNNTAKFSEMEQVKDMLKLNVKTRKKIFVQGDKRHQRNRRLRQVHVISEVWLCDDDTSGEA